MVDLRARCKEGPIRVILNGVKNLPPWRLFTPLCSVQSDGAAARFSHDAWAEALT